MKTNYLVQGYDNVNAKAVFQSLDKKKAIDFFKKEVDELKNSTPFLSEYGKISDEELKHYNNLSPDEKKKNYKTSFVRLEGWEVDDSNPDYEDEFAQDFETGSFEIIDEYSHVSHSDF